MLTFCQGKQRKNDVRYVCQVFNYPYIYVTLIRNENGGPQNILCHQKIFKMIGFFCLNCKVRHAIYKLDK